MIDLKIFKVEVSLKLLKLIYYVKQYNSRIIKMNLRSGTNVRIDIFSAFHGRKMNKSIIYQSCVIETNYKGIKSIKRLSLRSVEQKDAKGK